jgi:excisionase family DNA binding protein
MKDTEQSPIGAEKFLTVPDVASILSVKQSTVYQWAKSKEIPHYRLGRIVRFKRKDLDVWIEDHRKEKNIGEERKAREILKAIGRGAQDIDRIIKKSIADVKGNRYTSSLEKPGKDKGLGKEAEYGLI